MAQCTDSLSCAQKLKVLADETRLAVMHLLMDGPHYVGELSEALSVEQSLMSHHLKLMREAGVVQAHRDGKAMRYEVADNLRELSDKQVIDLGCCKLSFD